MKIMLGTLILGSAISMNAFANTCSLNEECDMTNAPLVITLEKGKDYTCHLHLNNRELTTAYQVFDNNYSITTGWQYIDLSYYIEPATTSYDISISTAKFATDRGKVVFDFIPDTHLAGWETVTCTEKNPS
jgi:hypothetical protein